jgi:hypothetical protein
VRKHPIRSERIFGFTFADIGRLLAQRSFVYTFYNKDVQGRPVCLHQVADVDHGDLEFFLGKDQRKAIF